MESLIPCSFCHQSFPEEAGHDCVTKIYSIINSASQKKNPSNLFNEIDNIVFQGGGVRGISYVGALKEITDDNPNFLHNAKRFAGTSAGSVFALLCGLNFNTSEIEKIMVDTDFNGLLDDGIVLKVCMNIEKSTFDSYIYENFRARDIFFAVRDYYRPLLNELNKGPTPKTKDTLKERLKNIYRYYGSKKSWGFRVGMGFLEEWATRNVTTILLSFYQTTSALEEVEMEKMLSVIAEEARAKAAAEKPVLLQGGLQGGIPSEKVENSEAATLSFYKLQSKGEQPVMSLADRSKLQDEKIDYALGELLYYTLISQTDASGHIQEKLGLFTGSKLKQDLIEKAIETKFKSIGRSNEYKKDFTFAELASFKDEKGKPLFKPFYAVSYNSSNFRSEVFSVEHTPNVVVADAVRASMSIPFLFQAVTVRENGVARKVYYNNGQSSEEIKYMDGAVFDNYPVWVFDDLKYLLEDIPTWVPDKKIAIQNHRTLGFRLLSGARIDQFKEPYYDDEETQRKRVANVQYNGSLSSMLVSVKNALYENENEFIKYGESARAVFVYDLGIRTTDFDLSGDQKKLLIQSGRNAVRDYIKRAKRDFAGEGEKYA